MRNEREQRKFVFFENFLGNFSENPDKSPVFYQWGMKGPKEKSVLFKIFLESVRESGTNRPLASKILCEGENISKKYCSATVLRLNLGSRITAKTICANYPSRKELNTLKCELFVNF